MPVSTRCLFLLAALMLPAGCQGQTLSYSFLQGQEGWQLRGNGRQTQQGLAVEGSGSDSAYWMRTVVLKPHQLYHITFSARTQNAQGGVITGGANFVNHDFPISAAWQTYSFYCTTPRQAGVFQLRMGAWHVQGETLFRNYRIAPALPLLRSTRSGPLLGPGEQIDKNQYRFDAPFYTRYTNYSRVLHSFDALFNTDRWVFTKSSSVEYRLAPGNLTQTAARLSVNVNYCTDAALNAAVSTDGRHWTKLGRMDKQGRQQYILPAQLFPARAVYVRIAMAHGYRGMAQTDSILYTASLRRSCMLSTAGENALHIETCSPGLQAEASESAVDFDPTHDTLQLLLTSRQKLASRTALLAAQSGSKTVRLRVHGVAQKAGGMLFRFPPPLPGFAGRVRCSIYWKGSGLGFSASLVRTIPQLFNARYGHLLQRSAAGAFWWCGSTRNIALLRPAPARSAPLQLEAARQERRAVQLSFCPAASVGPLQVKVSAFRGANGAGIAASALRIRQVCYVQVSEPTDSAGATGRFPDPLPLLKGMWKPAAGRNNPLWLQITVPRNAAAGEYHALLKFAGRHFYAEIPLALHVFAFRLPRVPALRSAIGISAMINRYQNLTTLQQKQQVWNRYMLAFARNRLSPYDPMALAPYSMQVVRNAEGRAALHLNFSQFDHAAHQYLDGLGFTSFVLQMSGLPYAVQNGIHPGEIGGYAADSPQYKALMQQYGRQLQQHLQQHGWLSRAIVYPYDEPQESAFPLMRLGLGEVHAVAPKLHRILTVRITRQLNGFVDIWCPLSPNYSPAAARTQRSEGRQTWWYICTVPKTPYAGYFIDHSAIEPRMWLWQTWKYGVQGILIWSATYWNSPQTTVGVQNPWKDAMSYVDGGSGGWGNGDGRLLYPPNRHPNRNQTEPILQGPVPSLRWEMLGEGVEDWQYFYLLQGLVEKAAALHINSALLQKCSNLLQIPASICSDMTHFTSHPSLLHAYRLHLAEAVEALQAAEARH